MAWSPGEGERGGSKLAPSSSSAPEPRSGTPSLDSASLDSASSPISSVVVDPIAQVPDSIAPPPPSRVQRPQKRRTAESTLVLRTRQLDGLRAEVRRRQAAFQRRRYSSLIVWGLAGGAAVLAGALLARGWDDDRPAGASPSVLSSARAVPVEGARANRPPDGSLPASAANPSANPSAEPAAGSSAASAASSTLPATKAGAAKAAASKRAAAKRPLSLDELPTK